MMKLGVLAAAVVAMSSILVHAKPAHTTSYTYYTVRGNTVESIHRSMLSKGPKVNGVKAYAATTATTRQAGKLLKSKSCRIENYHLKLYFTIKLPKVNNEATLADADRESWRQFSSFLRTHEEAHRAIWLECATDMERQIQSIKAESCDEMNAKAEQLWEQNRAACAKKHDAFDQAEQRKLMTHPFVQLVYKRSASTTHAASAE